MGCPQKAAKIAKRIGRMIKASVMNVAISAVKKVEELSEHDPLFFTNDAKRRIVGAEIKAAAKREEINLAGRTVGLITEFAVEAVKGPDDESDLGVEGDPEESAVLDD